MKSQMDFEFFSPSYKCHIREKYSLDILEVLRCDSSHHKWSFTQTTFIHEFHDSHVTIKPQTSGVGHIPLMRVMSLKIRKQSVSISIIGKYIIRKWDYFFLSKNAVQTLMIHKLHPWLPHYHDPLHHDIWCKPLTYGMTCPNGSMIQLLYVVWMWELTTHNNFSFN